MRTELKKMQNIRKTFIAVFKRYGAKNNWNGFSEKTILLVDVKDLSGNTITDHIWFRMTKGFEKIGELHEGTKIQFDARVKEYIKGYVGYREELQWERPIEQDYKLNNPSKIKVMR
jgi:hypothetical protein